MFVFFIFSAETLQKSPILSADRMEHKKAPHETGLYLAKNIYKKILRY